MPHVLPFILKWSIVTVGVLIFYASLSYETEDGKIQSLLELWWIKVDDLKKQALSRHIAFIKTLASVITSILNKLFGIRIYSVESLGVSICYSDVCLGIFSFLLYKLRLETRLELPGTVGLIAFGLIYGSLPILLRKVELRVWKITAIHVWFIALIVKLGWGLWIPLFYIIYNGLTQSESRKGVVVLLVVAMAFVLGEILFWFFVGLMRYTVRTISQSQSPMKIVGYLSINLAPVFLFVLLTYIAFEMPDFLGDIGIRISLTLIVIVPIGVVINLAFILSGILFVLLALTMLLHRLFWPAIDRPLYKLQALGIAKRPRVFAAIGLALIGIGWKAEWVKSIVDKLF